MIASKFARFVSQVLLYVGTVIQEIFGSVKILVPLENSIQEIFDSIKVLVPLENSI